MAIYTNTSYGVRRGDTLWSIAEQAYGHGRHWKFLQRSNPEVVGPNGEIFVGTGLRIPELIDQTYAERVCKLPPQDNRTLATPIMEEAFVAPLPALKIEREIFTISIPYPNFVVTISMTGELVILGHSKVSNVCTLDGSSISLECDAALKSFIGGFEFNSDGLTGKIGHKWTTELYTMKLTAKPPNKMIGAVQLNDGASFQSKQYTIIANGEFKVEVAFKPNLPPLKQEQETTKAIRYMQNLMKNMSLAPSPQVVYVGVAIVSVAGVAAYIASLPVAALAGLTVLGLTMISYEKMNTIPKYRALEGQELNLVY